MREILFKGISIEDGEWKYGQYLYDALTWDHLMYGIKYDSRHDEPEYVDPETICQFTGLLDRNGDKIFEGDILQYDGVLTQYTVVFEKCGFELKRKSVCFGMLAYEHDQYDIIGNIHDGDRDD